MIFRQKVRRSGGGDNPLDHGIFFHYYKAGSFWDRFRPYRAEVVLRDLTYKSIGADQTKSLKEILESNLWIHNDQQIWPWIETMVTRGKVKMTVGHRFSIEGYMMKAHNKPLPDDEKPWIRVRFSDKGTAALFKLTFGGR